MREILMHEVMKMNNLLVQLFWDPEEISKRADLFCETLPGYHAAKQQYEETMGKMQEILGYDLYDQLLTHITQYTNYEVYSHYFFGLGLRQELVKALGLQTGGVMD